MRILVVGGAGYVGCELCAQLLSKGHEVEVDDLMLYGDDGMRTLRKSFPSTLSFYTEDISSDMYSKENRRIGYAGVDACVNLAGFSNDPIAQAYPALNWKWNVYGAARVAEMCKETQIPRLIYASSASVYHTEDFAADVELGEGAPVRPHWHYSMSKYAGELASSAFHDPGKLDVIIVRKGTICGVSRRMRFDLMLNGMFASAMRTAKVTVDGGGGVYRPVLDIKDAVSAYVALIEADGELVSNHRPEIFNVVSQNDKVLNYAVELARSVRFHDGRTIEVAMGPARLIQRSYRVSSRKLTERLGWLPQGTCQSISLDLNSSYYNKEMPDFSCISCYNIKALQAKAELT